MTTRLTMWTVYDHPTDFPEHFVARRWIISAGGPVPSSERLLDDSLAGIRAKICAADPNVSVPLKRSQFDDPNIVETWI